MLHIVQRPVVRIVMVGIVLLTIQTTLLAELRPFGVSADIMLGASVAAGIVAGAEQGALTGFVLGIMFDLVLITPFGLSPFAYGMVAFMMGAAKEVITVGHAWWLTTLLVVTGSVSGIVLFALSGSIIGQLGWVQWHLLTQAGVVGGVNALVGLPLSRVMKWALRVEREQ